MPTAQRDAECVRDLERHRSRSRLRSRRSRSARTPSVDPRQPRSPKRRSRSRHRDSPSRHSSRARSRSQRSRIRKALRASYHRRRSRSPSTPGRSPLTSSLCRSRRLRSPFPVNIRGHGVATPTRESNSKNLTLDSNVTFSQLVQALQMVGNSSNPDRLSNLNTIPEFDPSRKQQTIVMWLHKVNECAVIYNWTDKQTAHFALPKLKGQAQKWYEGLPTVLYSWQEWQEKLKLAFPSDENYGQLLTTMLSKRARFSNSLEDYYYEKIVLLNRCGIGGKRAVDCVVFGIDDRSVRLGAEAARFGSPEQLLPYLRTVRNYTPPIDRKRTRYTDTRPATSKDGNKERLITCYNCLQVGHYKSQCPKPSVKCTQCLRFGHTVDKCNIGQANRSSHDKSQKAVLCVSDSKSDAGKYYKRAFVNGAPIQCFIDFGSAVTMLSATAARAMLPRWDVDDSLPSLRGFGEAVVKPLGKATIDLRVDEAQASVIALVVPDEVMRVSLLVGQSFTEQPHIIVEKDNVNLRLATAVHYDVENVQSLVKLYCCTNVVVDGITVVDVYTDDNYTGDLYISGSSRFQFGYTLYIHVIYIHYLVQGLFTMTNGLGVALIKGSSKHPFVLKKDRLIARCRQAKLDSLSSCSRDVLQVYSDKTPRPIVYSDLAKGECNGDPQTLSKLLDLLNKYRECFAFDLQELGKTNLVEMSIRLKDNEPVVYRPYRLPFLERNKVREMIKELLDCDVIRPSTSCYASPIVLVKKKTSEIRLCVDYRALNRKTIKENYPLPRIDDQLDDLAGYSFYTTLDLASGYYQIPIAEADRHKTSFVTPDGQYEFNRMPFGLANAPSTFMRMINLVLNNNFDSDLVTGNWEGDATKRVASAYMDDIIVPSATIEEGLRKLEMVLMLLKQGGLTLKLSKCCFFREKVEYLGFELSSDGIRPGSSKIKTVQDFPEPINQHTFRQFLGLCMQLLPTLC